MKHVITKDPRWNIILAKFKSYSAVNPKYSNSDCIPSLRENYDGWTAFWIHTRCPLCDKSFDKCKYIYWYRTKLDEASCEYKPYCSIKCIVADVL